MEIDNDKIDDAVLALLYLTLRQAPHGASSGAMRTSIPAEMMRLAG